MKRQFGKVLAMLMVVLMVMSMFCFSASAIVAENDNSAVIATLDEATADETTADEDTEDEATTDELGFLGDVDLNGKVNIKDATLIQKALADLATLDELQVALADANVDGKMNIKDATEIQKYLADLPANALIGTAVTAEDLIPVVPETPDVPATDDEITSDDEIDSDDEITSDDEVIATDDEVIATDDEVISSDDEVVEPVVEAKYYAVGWINNTDVYDYTYEIVDGTITIEITSDSYFAVMDDAGTTYWTKGWLDFNPTSAVLGEYGSENNKFHVSKGTVTFTWDAETFTLAIA